MIRLEMQTGDGRARGRNMFQQKVSRGSNAFSLLNEEQRVMSRFAKYVFCYKNCLRFYKIVSNAAGRG